MPGHGTPGPCGDPERKGRPLIDSTPLFSALEGAPRSSAAALPPPTTNPFQAPDFGEDDDAVFEDAQEPVPGTSAA
ncbi:hypothetical protein GCM10010249_02600 [Streptomyces roseolilacinus]|uniref:Uncharacterized protein n=1 Tax=Streptomyces roseolilacinus TaxID=66904 RepID=A0A918AX55_9ACTN|nr:hypothetical protein GCM10010249_02600 [Streptomyces roseolilacinus]